ncbi:MAG: hypothetical protein AAGA10_17515 [Bacteroidota bacterium]
MNTLRFLLAQLCVGLLLLTSFLPALAAGNGNPPALYVAEDITIQTKDGEYTLRAGTQIVVEATQTYDSEALSAGQSVNVRVKYNVIVKKHTLIAAGAMGNATISSISKPKIFGKGGEMEVQIQNVQAVDGQQIPVTGIPMRLKGDNKAGLAWGLSIPLFLLTFIGGAVGFLIKGKPAELRSGMTLNANVASDMEIEADQ